MTSLDTRSLGRCLEKTELLRSGLRWRNSLDKNGISQILRQVNSLRDDLLFLTKVDRYKKKAEEEKETDVLPYRERRQALLERNFVFKGIFGDNPVLLQVLETLEKAARSDLPVLIEGESGTGKELLAQVVHENSNRSHAPFVSVNCGAIPDALLESELFGHVKGAFTGAIKDRQGKFEQAHQGTLFLDEIGELSLENQVKLLRALQAGEIQRVGRDESITVDARIVAATNRNLLAMMKEGSFREDLYYRISVISVTSPALRERPDEIPLLVDYFLAEAAERLHREPVLLDSRLTRFLKNYGYPGNIRELQNIIYRLTCLAEHTATLSDLPLHVQDVLRKSGESAGGPDIPLTLSLEEVRKQAIEQAEIRFLEQKLVETNGNVTKIAELMDMNRSYLQKLLKKHDIRSKEFKQKKSDTQA